MKKTGTWLRYGCFGCLGLLGVVLVAVLVVLGVGWAGARSEKVAEEVLEPNLPAPVAQDVPAPGGVIPAGVGRVELHLSEAEFRIRPAGSGEALRVVAHYDKQTHELSEELTTPSSGPWHYRVEFRQTASTLAVLAKGLFGGTSPQVDVFLPADAPIELWLSVSRGGADADLGGLWLTAADVHVSQGGLALAFDEPLRAPIDRLSLRGSMGGLKIRGVAHASPRVLDLDYSMGGIELDLRGEWARDCELSIHTRMAGGQVRLPRDVRVEGLADAGPKLSPPPEVAPVTLRFSVDIERGEVQFVD